VSPSRCAVNHTCRNMSTVSTHVNSEIYTVSKLATPPYRLTRSLVDNIIMPRRMVTLSDTPIRPSVCPSPGYSTLAAWRSCLGYRHAGCLQLAGHQRCADCGPVHGRTYARRELKCQRRGEGSASRRPPGRYLVLDRCPTRFQDSNVVVQSI